MPVLAVSGSAGEFVAMSLRHVAPDLMHVRIPDVGHYLALEAPDAVAEELRAFYRTVDTAGEAVDATETSS